MKWWAIVLVVGLLIFSLVLIYEKTRNSRTISELDALSKSLEHDKRRMAAELEFLRSEIEQSARTIERLADENDRLGEQLARSVERSAVLETILEDSATVTEGLAGGIDEAVRLVDEVIKRIKIDRAAITGTIN